MHVREGVKKHDIHIKSKFYKLKLFKRVDRLTCYKSFVW